MADRGSSTRRKAFGAAAFKRYELLERLGEGRYRCCPFVTIVSSPVGSGTSHLLDRYGDHVADAEPFRTEIHIDGARMSSKALLDRLAYDLSTGLEDPLVIIDHAPELDNEAMDELLFILEPFDRKPLELIIASAPTVSTYRELFPDARIFTGSDLIVKGDELDTWMTPLGLDRDDCRAKAANGIVTLLLALTDMSSDGKLPDRFMMRSEEAIEAILKEDLLHEVKDLMIGMVLLGSGPVSELSSIGITVKPDVVDHIRLHYPYFGIDLECQTFRIVPLLLRRGTYFNSVILDEYLGIADIACDHLVVRGDHARALQLAESLSVSPERMADLIALDPAGVIDRVPPRILSETMRALPPFMMDVPLGYRLACAVRSFAEGRISNTQAILTTMEADSGDDVAEHKRVLEHLLILEAVMRDLPRLETEVARVVKSMPLISAFKKALNGGSDLMEFERIIDKEMYREELIPSTVYMHLFVLTSLMAGEPFHAFTMLRMHQSADEEWGWSGSIEAADRALTSYFEGADVTGVVNDLWKAHAVISELSNTASAPVVELYLGIIALLESDPSESLRHLGAFRASSQKRGSTMPVMYVDAAIAFAELAKGRPMDALVRLDRVKMYAAPKGLNPLVDLCTFGSMLAAVSIGDGRLLRESSDALLARKRSIFSGSLIRLVIATADADEARIERHLNDTMDDLPGPRADRWMRLVQRCIGKRANSWSQWVDVVREGAPQSRMTGEKGASIARSEVITSPLDVLARKRLIIKLFGGFEVVLDGENVAESSWGKRKAKYLLAMLAAEERMELQRERALDALWPSLDRGRARNNLHSTTSVIRRVLGGGERAGGFLSVSNESLGLDDEFVVSDVALFLRIGTDVLSGKIKMDASETLAQCRAAAELYDRDMYMPAFDNSDHFLEKREECERRFLDIAVVAIRAALELDDRLSAQWFERKLADHRTLREDIYLERMRALESNDQRPEAIELYHDLSSRLREELGIEPGERLATLYSELIGVDIQRD